MPKIRQYEQQTRADGGYPNRPNPHAVASDFGGTGLRGAGAALQGAGADVARADRALKEQAERLEVTDAYTNLSRINAKRVLDLREREQKVDPRDETFSTAFMEDVKTELDQVGERYQTAGGKATWARGAADLSRYFVEQSGLSQAKRAGIKATEDFAALVDANQIVVNNDPTQFDRTLQITTAALSDPAGSYARIPAEHRENILRTTRTQLANAAMEGIIRSAPELGKQMLANPSSDKANPAQYVTGEHLDALKSKADAGIERQHTLKERERVANKIRAQENEDKLETGMIQRILDPKNHGGPPSDVEIASSGMTADGMRTIDGFKAQRLRELEARQEEKTHPAVVRDLLNQMIADGDDPIKSYNLDGTKHAYRKGLISTKEYTFLADRFARLKDESTNTFEKDLNAMMGTASHVVSNSVQFAGQPVRALGAINRIRVEAYAKAEALRKENKDPREMFDPVKGFFTKTNLSSYMGSASQALAEGADAVRAKEAPAIGTILPSGKGPVRFKGGDQYKEENWELVDPALVPPSPQKPGDVQREQEQAKRDQERRQRQRG